MAFLTEDDYAAVCDEFELEQIADNDTTREQAEQAAIEQVSSYTCDRYDMDAAFAATGSDRNPMLVQVTINIALYILVHRLPQQMGSDRRTELYEESVRWLRDVQASKASPDLPKYVSEDGTDTDTHNPVRWGSAIDKVSGVTW